MLSLDQSEIQQVVRIPLTRRISEIMQEKGDAYSIRAFSSRIGISRETLRLLLLGDRPITPPTLEKIAKGLDLSIERLRQMDTLDMEQSLAVILDGKRRTKSMLSRARTLAEELLKLAVGASERGQALNNLGRVEYLHADYDAAHQYWLKAFEHAKEIQQVYDDRKLLHLVSANLMLTYAIRKDYSNIDELLRQVEQAFPNDPDKQGKTYFTRMMVQRDRGNLEEAKKYSYRSLEHFEQTQDSRQIGHALINVAHFEYLVGNFKTAARALSTAIKTVEHHEDILVIAVKEYVKSLVKLRDYQTARQILERYESVTRDFPDYWGKLQTLYTVVTDNPTYADRIINDPNMALHVRSLACNCLFQFYTNKDDAQTAMSYYKKGLMYSSSKSNFYEQEGF